MCEYEIKRSIKIDDCLSLEYTIEDFHIKSYRLQNLKEKAQEEG